jgi:hypothetical protein
MKKLLHMKPYRLKLLQASIDSDNYPVPGGITGPTCLREYIYIYIYIRRPGPPGWVLGVGLTTLHHKKTTVMEPQIEEAKGPYGLQRHWMDGWNCRFY